MVIAAGHITSPGIICWILGRDLFLRDLDEIVFYAGKERTHDPEMKMKRI